VRWFLPRDNAFLELFDQSSENILKGLKLFREMVADRRVTAAEVEAMKAIEHEGDHIAHETFGKLNSTFITPFDREDIHALISRMDDVLDAVDAACSRIFLYRIGVVPEPVVRVADLLVAAAEQMHRAVVLLHDTKRHREALAVCVDINRLENEADQLHREVIGDLFADSHDAIEIMKLKEIYTILEEAMDRCEDVANAIESIIIKGV
jgi:predicted phosphate transport protein (TIGR00153 family)